MRCSKFQNLLVIGFSLMVFRGEAIASDAVSTSSKTDFSEIEISKLIVMPSSQGHSDWVDAIRAAKSSIHMTIFHLTDAEVLSAFEAKAADTSVEIKIIVDGKSATGGYQKAINELRAAGVQIKPGSKAFSLTHSKDMVIDGNLAFVGAVNLTNTATKMRDFALITPDAAIIAEIENVFAVDWQNADDNTELTPSLSDDNLVWSPTSSVNQLTRLIDSAKATIVLESENFNDTDVIDAINRAVARRVDVQIVLPECSLGNASLNYKGIAQLKGANVHMEHDGGSIDQPYMHSKMMLVDDETAYIGSINFSFNSILNDRELGVIFRDPSTTAALSAEFAKDWHRSADPDFHSKCASKVTSSPDDGETPADL